MNLSHPPGNSDSPVTQVSPDPKARLEAWQRRLDEHFRRLAEARRRADWPVFALEHGLSDNERGALTTDVLACVGAGPRREVALPWIVYSAEIGYEYSGFEYWQTFESQTPGWQNQWRSVVRSRFIAFAEAYHGAEPDGDWAHQFSIIAWPITHGVLPRDLQRQLAELLYDASMSFSRDTFSSAETLGRHLQARCHHYSSRFRQFAENTKLLGQIALALLLHDTAEPVGGMAGTILSAGTLARIVSDLNGERDARQWLADARSATRFRIRGLSRIPVRRRDETSRPHGSPSPEASDTTNGLPRPRFLLREQAPDKWRVRIELPNLTHLATRSPLTMDFMMRHQGRVAGATVPILAAGRILRDVTPTIQLSEWPEPQTQLLWFDNAPPDLEAALRAGFRMNAAEQWLFLIGIDGARELTTRILRTGASYVLLGKKQIRKPPAGVGIRPLDIECAGVFGLRIDVPDQLTDNLSNVLGVLGLEVAPALEVWPAGLPVPNWTGDGYGEWVFGQPIILGVSTDRYPVQVSLTIDGASDADFCFYSTSPSSSAVYLQLPNLGLGRHRITIIATAPDSTEDAGSQIENLRAPWHLSGELTCVIRQPCNMAAGQLGAVSFAVLPKGPSLEDIWEDRIDIHVAVPGASSMQCRVKLLGSLRQEISNRRFTLPTPCDTAIWRRRFGAHRSAFDDTYDDARSCTITFEGGQLGHATLSAERDFRSLRWAVRRNGQTAELIDLDISGNVSAASYKCSEPAVGSAVDPVAAQLGIEVENEGRLLVARRAAREAALVCVPRQSAQTFASLLVRPQVNASGRSIEEVRRLVALSELWQKARLGGSSLAHARQQACVQAIISAAFGVLAGSKWAAVEELVRRDGNLAEILRAHALTVAPSKADEETREMFVRRLSVLRIVTEQSLEDAFVRIISWLNNDSVVLQCARFALALAANPVAACRWADDRPLSKNATKDSVTEYLERLSSAQFIARAARYVRLRRFAVIER